MLWKLSKNRPLGEEMILTETAVSLNGPNPMTPVVEEAMRLYWRKCRMRSGERHFIRKSENVMSWLLIKLMR